MPLDYAIETDVKPIIRDFKTGAVLDPGGAGDKYVVDHRGKRVPYEILPDSTPSPGPKRARIKSEPDPEPNDRLHTVDIKSEDEGEGANTTPMAGTRGSRRRDSSRQHAAIATAPISSKTPCLSTHRRDRKAQARNSPYDNDDTSSDDAGFSSSGSSSSEDSSSDETSSEDSDSSNDSDSSSSTGSSVVDMSSVFRPSKSPSRFADTPSPTTRSQSRIKQIDDSDSDALPTPSPPSKKKKEKKQKQSVKTTSVQRPASLSFYIPIRQTDCQNRPSSPVPKHFESPISPASSPAHGGHASKHSKKAPKSSKSSTKSVSNKPDSNEVRSEATVPAAVITSQRYRAATAGPSTARQKPGSNEKSSIQTPQKTMQSQVAQDPQESQYSSGYHSPKGKEVAAVVNEQGAGILDKKCQSNKRKSKKLRNKMKAKKKMRQQQQQEEEVKSRTNTSNRRGPPRQARIERSIETPGPVLPTPGPSFHVGDIHADSPCNKSPARSESGMFMTSPIQPPPTPGQSLHWTPPASPSPMHSSPPSAVRSKKRSRSVYENAVEAGIRSLTEAVERSERMTREMKSDMRFTRERLEQKLDQERVERQLLEQHWEERFLRARNDDRTERERVALKWEGKLDQTNQEIEAERKRIKQAQAEDLTFLHDQFRSQQSQIERMASRLDAMEPRLDEQASRLSVHQGQLDGQRALQQTVMKSLKTHTTTQNVLKRDQNEFKKEFGELKRQVKLNHDFTIDVSLNLEAARGTSGLVGTNQRGLAQARSCGGRNHKRLRHETNGMQGHMPDALSDTLIRSKYGRPNQHTSLRDPPGTAIGNASSSSSLNSARTTGQKGNSTNSDKPNEGALQPNSSSNPTINTHSASRGQQSEPTPSPNRPSPSTTNTPSEPRSQSTSPPVQRALVQLLDKAHSQPAPAATSSPLAAAAAVAAAAAAAAIEPDSSSRRLPHLTHQEMKDLIFNYPLSELEFTIDYDEDTDGSQTTAATVFLLNAPQLLIETRFRAFLNRPSFAFDLEDPLIRAKGCWAVKAGGQQDTQFKLYYDERNYAFTLSRMAVRLWHGEDSVLRLLLSKGHMAVHICHQSTCFNPEHIVVENHTEQMDRMQCLEDGWCHGHGVWSKCGPMMERRRCILS